MGGSFLLNDALNKESLSVRSILRIKKNPILQLCYKS